MTTTTEFQLVDINKLVPYANNARTHNKEQIPYTAEKAAEIKGISVQEMLDATCRNGMEFYSID